jgi:hypothetical protein
MLTARSDAAARKFTAGFDGTIKAMTTVVMLEKEVTGYLMEQARISMIAGRMYKEDELAKNYKAIMFPIDLYQEVGDVVAAFHGSPSLARQSRQKMSKGESALSGAAAGASMGASVGGGWGAVIGAVVGGGAGYASA